MGSIGNSGPIPKRSDQRRRNNKPTVAIDTAPGATNVEIPDADPDWIPAARRWYESLAESGQSVFYQPSDWATAWVWAELLNGVLDGGKPSAMMISAWASGATDLLVTEGSRRRMRLELAKAKAGDPDLDSAVTDLDAMRKRFAGKTGS